MSYINYKSKMGIILKLLIQDRITFILGDSGVGKTFLIDVLKDAKKSPYSMKETNLPLDKLVIIDDSLNISVLNDVKNGSVVFIDKYDSFRLEEKEAVLKKMANTDATWIIMTRNPIFPVSLGVSNTSYKELKTKVNGNDKIFELFKV